MDPDARRPDGPRQEERDALDETLARMEAKHGPVDEAEVENLMRRLSVQDD